MTCTGVYDLLHTHMNLIMGMLGIFHLWKYMIYKCHSCIFIWLKILQCKVIITLPLNSFSYFNCDINSFTAELTIIEAVLASWFYRIQIIGSLNFKTLKLWCLYTSIFSWKGGKSVDFWQYIEVFPILNLTFRCYKI